MLAQPGPPGQTAVAPDREDSPSNASRASSSTQINSEEDQNAHANPSSQKEGNKMGKSKTTDTEAQRAAYRSSLEDLVERNRQAGIKDRSLPVAFKHLCVRGEGGANDIKFGDTVGTMVC